MTKKIHYFNLIEIVLTVAVISFGVVVILGMLPKGLRASRNAATVSYASEIMEQMGYYIQAQGTSGLDDEFANVEDSPTIAKNYVNLLMKNNNQTNFSPAGVQGVYKYTGESAKGVYVIVLGNNETVDGEDVNNVLFSGMLRVALVTNTPNYAAKVEHSHDDKAGCYPASGDPCGSKDEDFKVKKAQDIKTVYMELSYPLSVDYAARSKSYYSFDAQ